MGASARTAVEERETVLARALDERRPATLVRPPAAPRAQEAPPVDLYRPDGALLDGGDVPDSPRDTARRRALVVADVVGLALAYAAVLVVNPPPVEVLTRWPLALVLPVWVLMHKLLGLYDRDDKLIHKSTLDELPKLIQSVLLGALVTFMAAPGLLGIEVWREQNILFSAFAILFVPGARSFARGAIRRAYAPERCVIVGSGEVVDLLTRKIRGHAEYGVEVLGYIDGENGKRPHALQRLGGMEDLSAVCAEHGVERVIVGFSSLSDEHLLNVIRLCKRARIKITVVPRLFEVIGHSVEVDEIEGMTVLGLRGLTRSRSSLRIKRAIDLTAAVVGLIALAPLFAAIALAIKTTSRGPIFYRSTRMGRHRPFEMLKFRTMIDGAEALKPLLAHLNEADGVMFKIAADPRVTRVGRFLRRTSLDELPQLWNVVRGEMSLVGPRPLVPDEDHHVIGWHRTRLELTPGLTGPWQVLGRTAIPFQEMVKIDYLYVAEWSLWNDIRLLLRTMPVVLLGRGH